MRGMRGLSGGFNGVLGGGEYWGINLTVRESTYPSVRPLPVKLISRPSWGHR